MAPISRAPFFAPEAFYSSILRVAIVLGIALSQSACNSSASAQVPRATTIAPGATVAPGVTGTSTTLAQIQPTDLTFQRYDLRSGMSYSYGFSIGDFDGDGRPDISYFDSYTSKRARLSTSVGAVGYIRFNTGASEVIVNDETFDFQTNATNSNEFLFERHVAVDITGDGLPDIVGVSNSHGAVVAYINPGVKNVPWVRRVLSSNTPGAVNLTVADVNGDGLPDVIVAMRYQPSSTQTGAQVGIAWLENTGKPTGEWIYHTIDSSTANFQDPRTVQAGDINQDGKMDVVTSDAVTGLVAWYEQITPDNWVRHVITGVSTLNAHFGRVLDMDGDGQLDILLPVTHGVAWLRNVNKGASWEVNSIVQFTDPTWSNIVTEVAPGDLHSDGTLDVVFSVGSLKGSVNDVFSGGLYVAHQLNSQWNVTAVDIGWNSCVGVQLVDFNGDGLVDIVSNNEYQQNAVTLWLNQKSP